MKWYVAQVLTGKETNIRDEMQKHCKSVVPQELMRERKNGVWKTVTKVLFPGYVFICLNSTLDSEMYYKLKPIPGVIKFLGDPSPLLDVEANLILRQVLDDDPLGISKVLKEGNKITVIEGPLKGLEGQIIKIDGRRYRAKVNISLMGEPRIVEMAVDVIKNSEE